LDIQKRMIDFNVPGVSVTYFDDKKIKWNKCFGVLEKGTSKYVNENSIFHACSISKMITSLCVLKLVESGVLDLMVEANKYLTSWKIPDNDFTREKKIKLIHLLSHQAGFYDIDGSFEPYKNGDNIPSNIDILKGKTRYNPEEIRAKYTPETDWAYSDAGFCVIEQIIKNVTGENICQVADRLIFKPLELKRTFFWEIGKEAELDKKYCFDNCAVGHDSNGDIVEELRACYPNLSGAALWSTSNELSIIALDIAKSYNRENGVVLSKDVSQTMLTPYADKSFIGLGVFLGNDNGQPYFFSQGWGVGMQCKLRVYYKEQRGVMVMTNSEPGMEQDKALIGEIINEVCKNNTV